jgi:hypothetical protein
MLLTLVQKLSALSLKRKISSYTEKFEQPRSKKKTDEQPLPSRLS